ncbi:hypothetical protein JCM33374_g3517 [Metschnikowia sp. JCM 33374]|nr:hypothetical protein JCM33374_g3517 [Metschnikowia sp. JCM 33374]
MPFRSQDDCFLPKESHFEENIDYLSPTGISDLHLHLCWRENNCASKKKLRDCTTMPSMVSRRLENIAWRRWDKQIWQLGECSPLLINWNKTQDVTWLYGPKYSRKCPFEAEDVQLTHANLSRLAHPSHVPEWEDDVSSVSSSSTRSMSFDDGSSVESVDLVEEYQDNEEDDENYVDLKSALKSHRHPFLKEKPSRKKSVKFNYIVNSREFMNGLSFDYHFLDTSCL